jgi:hypothetical protein
MKERKKFLARLERLGILARPLDRPFEVAGQIRLDAHDEGTQEMSASRSSVPATALLLAWILHDRLKAY